jgi:hypothetical protein
LIVSLSRRTTPSWSASALVLSGATRLEALDGASVIPDYVLEGVGEVLPMVSRPTGNA